MKFVAIDFETANRSPASACAVGLAYVESDEVHRCESHIIDPGMTDFRFAEIHGISHRDCVGAPAFSEIWSLVGKELTTADFVVAHNANYDRLVLEALIVQSGTIPAPLRFLCTRKLARELFACPTGDLASVCRALRISHEPHDPMSDALATARIALSAVERFGGPTVLRRVTPEIRYSSSVLTA